jgi:hypothetical protein
VNEVAHSNSDVGNVLVDGTSVAQSVYEGIVGLKLYTTNRADDSSYFMVNPVEDGSDDLYLQTQTSRFARQSAGAYMAFDETYEAEDGEDVVLAFKLKETNNGGTTYDDIFTVGSTVINLTSGNVSLGAWHDVKVVATVNGTSVYVDGATEPIATSSDTSISSIGFNSYSGGSICNDAVRSDSHPFGYPTYAFNDMIVYTAADGATSDVPNVGEQTEATPGPTATPTPPPADITDSVLVDFDNTQLEDVDIVETKHKDYSSTTVTSMEKGDDDSDVYQIAQTSGKDNSYGYVTLDFSSITAGKSHIIIDYDLYVGSSGRFKVAFKDGAPTEGTATTVTSLFNQGILSSSNTANAVADEWVHTTVDVDLSIGAGTYTVTKLDGTAVSSGKITTDLQQITTMSFISWSENTSYIDDLKIQTGGSLTVVTPEPCTAEPASEVEGSYIDLVPEGARDNIGTMEAAEGDDDTLLNHSEAKAAQSTENTAIEAYSQNARGYSIYAAYDVYLTPSSSIALTAYGDAGKAQTATMNLSADEYGYVTVSAISDKGATVTADETLSQGTWYRVLVEIPQSGTSEAPVTDTLTYTIYRINPETPAEVASVAAQLTGLSARGAASKGITSLGTAVEGDVYIDNSAVFLYDNNYSLIDNGDNDHTVNTATPEPASTVEGSYIDLLPDGATKLDEFSGINGNDDEVLNHSEAKNVVNDGTASVYNSDNNFRGKSVYAAYDVLVNAGDQLTLSAIGSDGTSIGTGFIMTGNADGTASVTATVNKGDVVNVGTLVCGTWYRVLIEIPQDSVTDDDGNNTTSTGNATYTVYRINATNPSEVSGVAVAKGDLTARNLSGKTLATLKATVTGTPYIDNAVAFLAENGLSLLNESYTKYTVTYDAATGRMLNVTSEADVDPTTVTVDVAGTTADGVVTKTLLLNSTTYEPYVAG